MPRISPAQPAAAMADQILAVHVMFTIDSKRKVIECNPALVALSKTMLP